jgi:hydrogenase 3 maturation protease
MADTDLIKNNLNGKILIVGIGNTMRGDDGAGPELVKRCRQLKVPYDTMDVGDTPENYVGKITKANYDTIFLVDAVRMNRQPGDIKVLSADKISDTTTSTHNFSMKTYINYITSSTNAKVYLVGIQPKDTTFGKGISPEILNTVDRLIKEGFLCTN